MMLAARESAEAQQLQELTVTVTISTGQTGTSHSHENQIHKTFNRMGSQGPVKRLKTDAKNVQMHRQRAPAGPKELSTTPHDEKAKTKQRNAKTFQILVLT